MSGRSKAVPFLLLLSASLWACGRSETESETAIEEAIPEAAPEPAAEATLAGKTLTTTISAEEAGENATAAGTWELTLAEDGSFTVRQDEEVAVEGIYTIEGDRITFTDTDGPAMCDEYPDGTYGWSIAGGQVTMTVIDDACAPRVTVLTTHPQTIP